MAQPRTGPVLAVFAHPDDAEISSGGTLARWIALERDVHLLVLTNGDRGSSDPALDRAELARIRKRESEAAGRVLGLASVRILDVHDGELENSAEIRAEVVRSIRTVRPSTVLSCDPTAWFFENSESVRDSDAGPGQATYYNHSDHRTAGVVALDSVFPGAGNPHFFSEHLEEGLQPHDVKDVWLGWTNEPNHVEDVSSWFRMKVEALARHESQLAEGIRFFEEFLEADARRAGKRLSVEFAEEFRVLDLS